MNTNLVRYVGSDGVPHWRASPIVESTSGSSETLAISQTDFSSTIQGIQTSLTELEAIPGEIQTYTQDALSSIDFSSDMGQITTEGQTDSDVAQTNAQTYVDGKVTSTTNVTWTSDTTCPSQLAVKEYVGTQYIYPQMTTSVNPENPSDSVTPSQTALATYVSGELNAIVNPVPNWSNPSEIMVPTEASVVNLLTALGLLS